MAQFGRGSVRLFFKGDPTLVGNWSFDEGAGTIAKDLSGKGNNGTLINGPLWIGGKFGGALSFDGVNDYVQISTSSSLTVLGNITIMAWIKPIIVGDGVEKIIYVDGTVSNWGKMIRINSSGYLNFACVQTSPIAEINAVSDVLAQANVWYHLVGVRDSSNVYVYVNGVRRGSATINTNPTRNSSPDNKYIGQIPTAGGYFGGLIDEVAIFSRALSSQEIQAYYNWAISKSTPIIYTPRKNASVLNVGGFLTKLLTEALTLIDNLLKTPAKVFSEFITLTDNLRRTFVKIKILMEILTLTDKIKKKGRRLWQKISLHTTIWTKSETNPNVGSYALMTENYEVLITEDGNVIIVEEPQTWQKEGRHSSVWNKLP